MTPTVQNLNAKLSPRPRRVSPRVAAANRQLRGRQAALSGAAAWQPRLMQAAATTPTDEGPDVPSNGYRGGYLIDV